MEKSNDENINNNIKNEKAMFISRLVAFLIDFVIVLFAASLIAIPFTDTKKINGLYDKSHELVNDFGTNKISTKEYIAEYINISYDVAKSNGMTTIIVVLIGLFYYTVIPLYNNGKTLGKKLMKIRMISRSGELTANQLIFRSFIANSLLLDFVSIILLLISSKTIYFYCFGLFSIIQYLITIVSIVMVMYGKNGLALHDLIARTKVVKG